MGACLAIVWVALTPWKTPAVSTSGGASATGVQDITIAEAPFRVLSFGSITGPTDQDQTFTISASGSPLKTQTAGNGSFISGQRRGRVLVGGEPNQEFTSLVAILNNDGDCSGIVSGSVTLTKILLNPLEGSMIVLGAGQQIDIGGELTVAANSRGNGTCTYFITVSYTTP